MLRSPKSLIGYRLLASDGEAGTVEDFLFDDRSGKVRYLVVGFCISDEAHQVLLAPECVRQVDPERQMIVVTLSRKDVESSPDAEVDRPVSAQNRTRVEYVALAYPWCECTGIQCIGLPIFCVPGRDRKPQHERRGDPHLRSVMEVATYAIRALDGWGGSVRDFLVDVESWAIRKILVKTRRWWPGRKVLVSWWWFKGVSYDKMEMTVRMTRKEIRQCPRYDPFAPWNTDYGVTG